MLKGAPCKLNQLSRVPQLFLTVVDSYASVGNELRGY